MNPNMVPVKCLSSKEFNDFVSLVERINEQNEYCPINYCVAVNGTESSSTVWVDVWSDSPSRLNHLMDEWMNLVKSFYELERKYLGGADSPLSTVANPGGSLSSIFDEISFNPMFSGPQEAQQDFNMVEDFLNSKIVLRKKSKESTLGVAIEWFKNFLK